MIKAVAGGGGRGMRQAHNDVSLVQGFQFRQDGGRKGLQQRRALSRKAD